jgi:outer membrane protein OmpA-like peptidoglycan-associated protein
MTGHHDVRAGRRSRPLRTNLGRHLYRLALLGSLALALVHGKPAWGQNQAFDLQLFRPAIDSKGFITQNASETLGHLDISFGLVTTLAINPLKLFGGRTCPDQGGVNQTCEFRVHALVTPQLQAAVGLFGFAELGVGIPIMVLGGDRNPDPVVNQDQRFVQQGLGDVGLHAKLRLLNDAKTPLGLAVIASFYLPTSTKTDTEGNFLGERGVTVHPTVVVDKELFRRLRVGINGGIRFRTGGDATFRDPFTNDFVRVAKTEATYGVGLSYAMSRQRVDFVTELYGSLPLTDAEKGKPVEALGAFKLYLARNSYFHIGAGAGLNDQYGAPDFRAFVGFIFEPRIGDRDGDGVKDSVDKCPDESEDLDGFEDEDGCPDPDNDRDGIPDVDDKCPNDPEDKDGIEDEDGCPEGDDLDRDNDGIPDDLDKCPDEPEDKDGFEDDDGCPDPDNDRDGILDKDDLCPNDIEDTDGFDDEDGCPDPDNDKDRVLDQDDKCPNEPETYNGTEDEDGCPDKGRVIVRKGKIEILDKVYFETARTVIKPISYPILNAVAATLKGNPQIRLLEIQGHADERGNDDYNLRLTDGRVASVKEYLINKGVEADRLISKGYGEAAPICHEHDEGCWSQNRRVEFVILKREGGGGEP